MNEMRRNRRYVVLVHFNELALQMINVRRQKADLNAAKIAKNLTRIERVNIEMVQVRDRESLIPCGSGHVG
jgi:hypothetical protein